MTDTPLTDGIFSKLSEDELLLINAVYDDKLKQIEKLQSELDYQKQAEMEYNEKHTRLMSKYQESIEEIKRLNNIINELEKWVVESIEKHTEDYLDWKYDRNVYLAGSKKLQNVLDKLQELKGE